ncbi:hypothetical protein BJF78_19425 [Pseudonocardia sp. CNS-139]|nr:hypothetical protein BJF78_19425 [Pseudonocardia sp. CNS-139]
MDDQVLRLRDVRKVFGGGRRVAGTAAVDGVSLQVAPGESVALVGESGCGKSTLARIALGLVEPSAGTVEFGGRPVAGFERAERRAFDRAVQIVFQDPSSGMNPRKTVYDIVRAPVLLHRVVGRGQVREYVEEVLERVGLAPAARYIDLYPHQISGGQRQRVLIARAVALRPAVIVGDEPVSALDVSVRAQILELLKQLQREDGLGYLLITHDLAVVRSVADRVLVMYLGRIVEEGTVEEVFTDPQHPYTKALLASTPVPDPSAAGALDEFIPEGEALTSRNMSGGCPFEPRCVQRTPECVDTFPEHRAVAANPTHRAACLHARRPAPALLPTPTPQ